MMKSRRFEKTLSMLLAAIMMLQVSIMPVFAEGAPLESGEGDAFIGQGEPGSSSSIPMDSGTQQSSTPTIGESGTDGQPAAGLEQGAPGQGESSQGGPEAGVPASGGLQPTDDFYLPVEEWEEPQPEDDGTLFWGMFRANVTEGMLDEDVPAEMFSDASAAAAGVDISDNVVVEPKVWINGVGYSTDELSGQDIAVHVGDSFSYQFNWNIAGLEEPYIEAGSTFKKQIFHIPGLNLASRRNVKMVIDGVCIGTYSIVYDQTTGDMKFAVLFNQYAAYFDSNTIMGMFRGNGRFQVVGQYPDITLGEESSDVGQLIVEERPAIPPTQIPDGGTGWKPASPPRFADKAYPFGKGLKWTTNDVERPMLEWRVAFLNHLQDVQSSYLQSGDSFQFPVRAEYCIIEETLDNSQKFICPSDSDDKYQSEAPFFFELPIITPGTGTILSTANYGAGNDNYDGNGDILPIVTGRQFVHKETKAEVLEAPLSWTVVKENGRETLVINTGRLGTADAGEGLTYSAIDYSKNGIWGSWDAKLASLIDDCQKKMTALESGADSPLILFDARSGAVISLLTTALGRPENAGRVQEAETILAEYDSAYREWIAREEIKPLLPLTDTNGQYIAPPDRALLAPLEDLIVDSRGGKLSAAAQYKNWVASYDNLQADQGVYLENYLDYLAGWEQAKAYYQNTREFYQEGRVYGFVLKLRTQSTNTSITSYTNNVRVSWGSTGFDASDTTNITFDTTISGNYQAGSLVMQKADSVYDTAADDKEDIRNLPRGQGLTGAEFQVYCDPANEGAATAVAEKNLAHFLPKDASENGDTYQYLHSGIQDKPVEDAQQLTVNSDGRLILGNMNLGHAHWLVERTAPKGYYLDDTPIRLNSDPTQVIYKMLPNVARAVMLTKEDSRTGQPVPDAGFTLTQKDSAEPVKFTTKVVGGVTGYWQDANGTAALKTNAQGELRLHGLDTGDYVLTETGAPGYVLPAPAPSIAFTLEEKQPQNLTPDENGFYYIWLNNGAALTNDPATASVTLKKENGKHVALPDAFFALLEWTGTESEWEINPGDVSKWKPVTLNADTTSNLYFTTAASMQSDITAPSTLQPLVGAAPVTGAATGADGSLTISNIPIGHFMLVEVQAPASYKPNDQRFYFDVNAETLDEEIRLYRSANGSSPVDNNIIHNYEQPAKFALVKYAEGSAAPEVTGVQMNPGAGWDETDDGWKFQGAEITGTGLGGIKYKLFGLRGVTPNPDPEELEPENTDKISGTPATAFDPCIAYGTTDANGVLSWEGMTYRSDLESWKTEGLPLDDYYLVEVAAAEGFVPDPTPVLLPLDARTVLDQLPDGETQFIPGLVKRVSNRQIEYVLEITKTDAGSDDKESPDDQPLAGSAFTIAGSTAPSAALPVVKLDEGSYRLATAADTGTITEMETGSDGKLTIFGAEKGVTYELTETRAPQGFKKLDAPVSITVDGTGTLTDGTVRTEKTIANIRLRGAMVLYKKDFATMLPLPDAEFQLYHYVYETIQPGDPDYDPDKPDQQRAEMEPVGSPVTSSVDGKVEFTNLAWDDQYFVQETKAPEGYLLDQFSIRFVIDRYSFKQNGEPIAVTFPAVYNLKGTMGEALLRKVDAEDTGKGLPGAEFFLLKNLSTDPAHPNWAYYGSEVYVTDANGEIRISLPPGDYAFWEGSPADGYLYPENPWVYYYFTIEDGNDAAVVFVEVPNQKGECGLLVSKRVTGTTTPIPDVAFHFYLGESNISSDNPVPLSFIKNEATGIYECVPAGTAGATTEVITDAQGNIRCTFPANMISRDDTGKNVLAYEEISAPAGIEIAPGIHMLSKPLAVSPVWSTATVYNDLTAPGNFALELTKTNEAGTQKLPGAEFELYHVTEDEEGLITETLVQTKMTGSDGKLVFDGLTLGEKYYYVESKAPTGFTLDKTHHEVVVDSAFLSDEYRTTNPIRVTVTNAAGSGKVHLKKVEAGKTDILLPHAAFELFKKNADDEWEHYGNDLYYTDENGEINLELPYGAYYWIERHAPNGYLLGTPQEIRFTVDREHADVTLDPVENQAEPGTHGSVELIKQDADRPSRLLPDAKFRLYQWGADGNWHLWSEETYTTDTNGRILIEKLPMGTFCFREIAAPNGYRLDADREYRFTVDQEGELESVTVTNKKKSTHVPGGSDDDDDDDWNDPGSTEDKKPAGGQDDSKGMPMTGSNWLLMLLLAAGGAVLLIVGLMGRKKQKSEDDRKA